MFARRTLAAIFFAGAVVLGPAAHAAGTTPAPAAPPAPATTSSNTWCYVPVARLIVLLIQLGNPILVGLAVCSHQPNHSDTVVFSNVSVEALATAPAKTPAKKKQ